MLRLHQRLVGDVWEASLSRSYKYSCAGRWWWKQLKQALHLQRRFAEMRIAHYPPYTSKYNPIEHRLFCHVTRACAGTVFTSIDLVKGLIDKTSTSTGLKVLTSITEKIYKTARKASSDFKENMPIVIDDYLGQWNYRAVPQTA